MDMRGLAGGLVGRNFTRIRREKGFTQESFCEVSGLHQSVVSGLETGVANPTIGTLFRLALALGVKACDLVEMDATATRELTKLKRRRQS